MSKVSSKRTPYGFDHFTNFAGDILKGFLGHAKLLFSRCEPGLPRILLLLKCLLHLCIFICGGGESSLKVFDLLFKPGSCGGNLLLELGDFFSCLGRSLLENYA